MKAVLLALALVAAGATLGDEKVVEATGVGPTYRMAVNEALVSAVEMTFGVTVSASERTESASSETSVSSSKDGDVDLSKVNDSISRQMTKGGEGRVMGYDVVSKDFDPATKKYEVTLAVRFYCPPGLDPNNRRRMAVAAFRSETGDSFSWYGRSESAAAWGQALADKLCERLTQTRKFTVLERKFDAEVDGELARLSGPNAATADAVRLKQKLGTDYLIVGSARFFPVVAPGVNPLTGQTLRAAPQKFVEVSYRVVLAATGQVKWADSLTLGAAEFAAADIASFASATADAAAARIQSAVMANILPFEIVGKTAGGTLVIGEGGKSLEAGERLTAFTLGETVRDSRTGEELDQLEEPVGTVEVLRVTAKVSYAKVVEGDAAKIGVGTRLRRPDVISAPAQPTAPITTTIKGNGTGGIVAPF